MPVEVVEKDAEFVYDDLGRHVDDDIDLLIHAARAARDNQPDDHKWYDKSWTIAPPESPAWYNEERDGPIVDQIIETLRPKPSLTWDNTKDLEFQVNDSDYIILHHGKDGFAKPGGSLCMRLFGGTINKESVAVIVPCDYKDNQTFWPRFKVEMPRWWGEREYLDFFHALKKKILAKLKWNLRARWSDPEPKSDIEIDELRYLDGCVARGDVLKGFSIHQGNAWEPIEAFDYHSFMEITVCYPTVVRQLRDLIHVAYGGESRGYMRTPWLPDNLLEGGPEFHRYSGRPVGLRCFDIIDFKYVFGIAHNYGGEDMIRIPARRYLLIQQRHRHTTAQYEFLASHTAIQGLANEKTPRVAPKLVLSNDIECVLAEMFEFPDPAKQKICTSCYVAFWHTPGAKEFTEFTIFKYQLGDTDVPLVQEVNDESLMKKCKINGKIGKIVTMHFPNERLMMLAEQRMRQKLQPDIYTGYNTDWFDLHYQTKRAEALEIDNRFGWLGRCTKKKSVTIDTAFQNRAGGLKKSRFTMMPGVVSMDVMRVVQNDFQLRKEPSFKLGAISMSVLGIPKVDLDVRDIPIYLLAKKTRKLILDYCHIDALLPAMMIIKKAFVIKNVLLCRGCGIMHHDHMTRGQTLKSKIMVIRQMHGWYVLYGGTYDGKVHKCFFMPDDLTPPSWYEGATVVEPKPDFYKLVIVLDYGALYPSVIRALNMDPSTMIDVDIAEKLGLRYETDEEANSHEAAGGDICRARAAKMDPDGTGDNGEYRPFHDPEKMGCFVHPNVREGVVPALAANLAMMRGSAKKERDKYEEGSQEHTYWEGMQNTMKEMTNSVYGFMKRVHWKIASSVTGEGRRMVCLAAHKVTRKYNKANGYPEDSDVVYGDTDSIFVKVWEMPIEQALKLGVEMSKYVNTFVRKPHTDEFEKCLINFNLHGEKKRYEGKMVTIALKDGRPAYDDNGFPVPCYADKIKVTGVESKRRDCPKFAAQAIDKFLDLRIMKDKPEDAIQLLRDVIKTAYARELTWDNFILSANISKNLDEYAKGKSPPEHAIVALKMAARDAGSAPKPGDRVPYVVTVGSTRSTVGQRVEHPVYAMEHDMEIDVNYYVTLLKGVIERITRNGMFPPKLIADVFNPANYKHRRVSAATTPGTLWSSMGAMVVQKCVGCGTASKDAVCARCEPMRPKMIIDALNEMGKLYTDRQVLNEKCTNCVKATAPYAGVTEIEDMMLGCREDTCTTFWGWRKQRTEEKQFSMGLGAVIDYAAPPYRLPGTDPVNVAGKRIRLEYEMSVDD